MASLISVRRPLTTLASRAVKQAPSSTPNVCSRTVVTAVSVSPESLALTGVRSFGTASLTNQSRIRIAGYLPRNVQRLNPNQQQSVRRNSDERNPSLFRRWGFEEITAALPTEPNAPSSASQTPQKNLILVDVREPAELISTGIIPSAVAVPLGSQPDALFLTPDEFETRFGFPKPGVEEQGDIVFYCKAGVRARHAAQLAVQAGYDPDRIGVYLGSWLDWADKGGRVEKWEGNDYH